MVDVKRMKATADLAKIQHDSYKTEESQAAYEAAQSAYEAVLLDAATDEVVTEVVAEINKVSGPPPTKVAVSSKQAPAPEGSTPKAKPVAEQKDVKKADAVVDKAAADAVAGDKSVLNLTAATAGTDDASATVEQDPTAGTGDTSGDGQADAGADELAEKKSE